MAPSLCQRLLPIVPAILARVDAAVVNTASHIALHIALKNRYSYGGNNPLSFSDPSGMCFLGCFWKTPTFRQFASIAVATVLQQEWALPALAADVGLTGLAGSIAVAGVSGGVSGYVATGKLQGALLQAAESEFFLKPGGADVGSDLISLPTASAFVYHGLVGGLFTVAGGGKFGAGFLAAGFGSLADNSTFDTGDPWGNTLVHALAGGVGSTLGGGKFANGAATAAFAYLVSTDDANNDGANTSAPSNMFAGPGASAPGNILTYSNGDPVIDPNTGEPYPLPPGMNVSRAVGEGREISGWWDFLKGAQIVAWFESGGPLDYQRPAGYLGALLFKDIDLQYRDVTNYLFGAVSAGAGYSKTQTLDNAGAYNKRFGNPSSDTPYGIRPDAVQNISQGYKDSSRW